MAIPSTLPTQLYINGQWQDAAAGGRLEVINPATEQVLVEVAAGSQPDVELAVTAAQQAFAGWSDSSGAERAKYLRAIAREVAVRADTLATLQSLNNGKPLAEAQIDVADVAACFDYYASLAEALDEQQDAPLAIASDEHQVRLRREACGVVGLIVPWNFPMVTTAWKVAPALAAGCTVVLKPSEVTPLPELALAAIIDAVGVPAGVFNLVTGTGMEVGAPLVAHPRVAKVSFTGSTAVGQAVMQAAAADIKGVSLELGGKSPILVFADAEIEPAVELILAGIFFNAGQMCSATSRLLVERSIAEPLLARLVERAGQIVVGDPLSPDTQMGPLTNRAQYQRVRRYIEQGHHDGASLLVGGQRPPQLGAHGYFIAPTIFAEVPDDSVLWREEIFGPVLCVRSFDSEAEAIALANDSEYGLAASIISGDKERAARVANRLQAGVVWINAPQLIFPQTSWGGFKKSSLGRELGPHGLAAFQEVKQVLSSV